MAEKTFSVRLTANVASFIAGMAQAGASTSALSAATASNLSRVGSTMTSVGRTMTTGVTLPLVALGGAAVAMSTQFDSAFSRMVGLAGVPQAEVESLKESVLDLAGETARSPQELAEALYFLRSSGLDSAQAMDALEMSAKASAAGLGNTATIADAVSSAMNAYAESGLSAAAATDILVATARAGKAEPEELAGALGRVLPIASELGITFEDVGGALAALSLTGNDASMSATLLSNVMQKLLKPSEQSAQALANVGLSTQAIRDSIAENGLLATLEMLRERLGETGFVKFWEDAQALNGALSLVGDTSGSVADAFDIVAASAGATDSAFGAVAEGGAFKMQQAWAQLQVALIQAGEVIVPLVTSVIGVIGSLASAFTELPSGMQTAIIGFAAFAAAIGPILMLGGSLVRNIGSIVVALNALKAAMLAHPYLALAAVIGGVLVGAIAELGGEAAGTEAQVRSLRDSLVEGTSALDAVNDSIKAAISETPELADIFNQVGVSTREVAAAALEGGAAWQAMMARFDAAGIQASEGAIRAWVSTLQTLPATAAEAARQAEAFGLAVADFSAEDATDWVLGFAGGLQEVGDAGAVAGTGLEAAAAPAEDLQTAFDAARDAVDALKTALSDVFGGGLGFDQAIGAQAAAVDALNESIMRATDGQEGFALTLDHTTAVGRENRDLIHSSVSAIQEYAAGMFDVGHSTVEVASTMGGMRDELVGQAMQFGLTRGEADAYISALGLTPDVVQTAIELLNQREAVAGLEETTAAAGDVEASDPSVSVTAPGATESTAQLRETDRTARAMTDDEQVVTSAPGATESTAQLRETDRAARTMSNEESVPTSAPGATQATGQLQDVDSAARAIPSSRNTTVTAEDNATGILERIRNAIAAIQSKTVTVTVQQRGAIPPGLFAAGGKVGPAGGIAGEAGTEHLKFKSGRTALVDSPTFVPAGTFVTPIDMLGRGSSMGGQSGLLRETWDTRREGGLLHKGGQESGWSVTFAPQVYVTAPYGSNAEEFGRRVAEAIQTYSRYSGGEWLQKAGR